MLYRKGTMSLGNPHLFIMGSKHTLLQRERHRQTLSSKAVFSTNILVNIVSVVRASANKVHSNTTDPWIFCLLTPFCSLLSTHQSISLLIIFPNWMQWNMAIVPALWKGDTEGSL
jgi:hypothetical protein